MESTGSRTRIPFYIIALALLVAYTTVSLSPLRESVGRQHPRVAALFSPPLFNFSANYTSGEVLEFKIGMNRLELAHVLQGRYANDAVLWRGCGDNVKSVISDVRIDTEEGTQTLLKKDVVCLWNQSKRLGMIFRIKNDSLSEIRVVVANNEM